MVVLWDLVGDDSKKTRVLLQSLSGDHIELAVSEDEIILSLKQSIAERFGFSVFDVQLVLIEDDAPMVADDRMLVCKMPIDSETNKVKMSIVRTPTTVKRYEEKGLEEWQEIAAKLQRLDIDDTAMLVHLRRFLDMYPALINWQGNASAPFMPLLGYAVCTCCNTEIRQQCVDELIQRGARVDIRHQSGFLIDLALGSRSAFTEYLSQKKREFQKYEKTALAAWRDVSSKLCGEASVQVHNEEEMTRIVSEFCATYPEMVNFQSNHVVDERTDEPLGYFGYAPLLSFAGGHACRRRRGGPDEDTSTRRGSAAVLLAYGARVDTSHGGRTLMEWLKAEDSKLVDWLKEQLEAPLQTQQPFKFERDTSGREDARNSTSGSASGGKSNCAVQ